MSLGNKEIMAKNIKRYLHEKDINVSDLCNALGFKYMTVSDWVNAKTYPRIDKIEIMAKYFGCSKADLVEERTPLEKMAEEDAQLVAKYRALSPEDRKTIDDMLEFLYEKAQKQK